MVPASYGVHSQAFHFWDGPGRRGSWGGSGEGGYYGLGADKYTKTRAKSMGEVGAVPPALENLGSESSASRPGSSAGSKAGSAGVYEWLSDGADGDVMGGGGGVFGEVAGKPVRVIDEVAIVSDDEEDEANNFYENIAEATTGKRKLRAVSQPSK